MAVCGSKTFLESINTCEQEKSSEWLAEDMIHVATSLDAQVTGVVTDNTSANMKAWLTLFLNQPMWFCHGCASHTLHLFVKD